MHAEVDHPHLLRIPEIPRRLRKRSEGSRSGLLLPNGPALARGCESDPQVLLVPAPQGFGIMSAEEQPSDSDHLFHFRFPRLTFSIWLRRRSRTCRLRGA